MRETFVFFKTALMGMAGLYAFGIISNFAIQIFLARSLSLEEFGIFGFFLSVVAVVCIPLIGGLPMLLTREVSSYLQAGNFAGYLGVVRGINRASIFAALVVGGLCFLTVHFELIVIFGIHTKDLALAGLVIIPATVLNALRSGVMKGLGHPVLSEISTQIIQPILLLIGYFVISNNNSLSLVNAVFCYVLCNLMALSFAYGIMVSKSPNVPNKIYPDYSDRKRWLKLAVPFGLMAAVWSLSPQIAIIFLGVLGQTSEVAVMRVAERGAMLTIIPLTLINMVIGPRIVVLYRSGNRSGLYALIKIAARLVLGISVLTGGSLLIFGEWLLSISFGEEYSSSAYLPMVILIAGQLSVAWFGPAGILLVMTGFENQNLRAQLIGLGVLVLLLIFAASSYGVVGAAVSVSTSLFVSSFFAFLYVKRYLKFRPNFI